MEQLSKSQKYFMRYETVAGEQMQYDWSPYTVQIDGNSVKINVHARLS